MMLYVGYINNSLLILFMMHILFYYLLLHCFSVLYLQRSEAQRVFFERWDRRRAGAQSNVTHWLQQSQPKSVPGCGKGLILENKVDKISFKVTPLNIFILYLTTFLTVTSLSFVLHVIQSSFSHPLNLSLCPAPPPLYPDFSSPWRWWIGSAPRGMTGKTMAQRGTTKAMDPFRM